jgi:hypothetical protein
MRPLVILLVLCLSGCANGFARYYTPAANAEKIATSPYVEKAPAQPKLYSHSGDLQGDYKNMLENGFLLIGTSAFYGPANKVSASQAIDEAKRVGAAVVLVRSSYKDTLSGVVPFTVPNPTQYATVNTTGTVNSYGSGGYATGNYNSSSTVAIPGGYSTYNIPYNISRNDFFASYWVQQDVQKMRLGIRYIPLPDEARQRLQRNTGILVPIVVRGTPAFQANILEGDVILKINGADVIDPQGFDQQLTQLAGQPVELAILRGAESMVIKVRLNPNPPGIH